MRENVFLLHQENIASAAETLFLEKGFDMTTISDISSLSQYSRRTLYRYFESKDEILYFLVIKGLNYLLTELTAIVESSHSFLEKYEQICHSHLFYYENYSVSAHAINQFQSDSRLKVSENVKRIFELGIDINNRLADWVKQGVKEEQVNHDVNIMLTVYIFSTQLHALFELASTKGAFLFPSLNQTKEEFLQYGYEMIIKGIIKERYK